MNYLEQIKECNGDPDKLFKLLWHIEEKTIVGKTDFGHKLFICELYNIPVYDFITGKIDEDVINFLVTKEEIDSYVDDLPNRQSTPPQIQKKKSKSEDSKVIKFERNKED